MVFATTKLLRLLLLGLGLGLVPPLAGYGVAAQVDPLPLTRDHTRLQAQIEERWKVIPLQGGLLLVPRRPSSLFKGVEIMQDGSVAIDGQTVTGAALRNRLGTADADPVLRLSYLSASERLALFQPQPSTGADSEPVERGGASRGGNPGTRAGAPASSGGGWTEVMPVVRGDRVRVGSDAVVDETEQVTNVTTILGAAVIDGIVTHDVLAIGGDVRLGPKAVVRGSIMTIGGVLRADPNARISGQISEVSLDSTNLRVWWPQNGINSSFNVGITPDWARITRVVFIGGLFTSLAWLLLCAGAFVIAPGAVAQARDSIGRSPIGSFAAGFATQLLFPPAMMTLVAVLTASVIGIPLVALVPLVMFAVFLLAIFGSTAMFIAIGERAIGRLTPLGALLVGGTLLCSLGLAGRYVWMLRGGGLGWGFALALLGLFVEYVVLTIGLGGAVIGWTRRIARRRKGTAASEIPTETPNILADEL